jgi:SAM-dependent methyltransferase
MIPTPAQEVTDLYNKESKHSAYQTLAPSVAKILGLAPLETGSHHERARLRCILSQVSIAGSRVLDIGGNTGFFTFSAIENGAAHVDYFEGNASHAQFVRTAAAALGLDQQIASHDSYYEFSGGDGGGRYDICFCLNVVHHLGDDFGDGAISIDDAKAAMIDCIRGLAQTSAHLVLQVGFNWNGDIRKPLFTNGLKSEVIDFILGGVDACWAVSSIQVAEAGVAGIAYAPANEENLKRFDQLGEFLNRPLFFLKSKVL